MTRRGFLASAAGPAFAQSARRPNVILALTDDQGYQDLHCHGNPWVRTPNLDRLHESSVRFTNHHSDPLCAPTRAGLMTGQYALRNAVTAATGGWSILPAGVPTMAELFRRNGYRTAIFGKWHLGENYPMRPCDRGFDESAVCRSGGVAQAADYWGNHYFDDHYYTGSDPKPYRGYCTDVFFRLAAEFIERNRQRPFFLYLPTNAPHDPFLVDPKYSEPYRRTGVPSPTAEFYGMIENIDENLGRLRSRLEKLGLAEDTIFVFMTDNGSSAGAGRRPGQPASWSGYGAGMRAGKGSPYEGGHRVPLFVHWPQAGWTRGRDIGELTCHLDLLPTLADLCGFDLAGYDLDGHSLGPLLRGSAGFPSDRTHFIEHHQMKSNGRYLMEAPHPWMNAVALTRDWRLVAGKELYDLRSDPGQKNDLAARNPEMVKTLAARYEDWWERMSTGFRHWTRIPIGGGGPETVDLSCFDWHGDIVPSNQEMIRGGLAGNGIYALRAEQPGEYEFTLRQRPAYVSFRLQDEMAQVFLNGRALEPQRIAPGAQSVSFAARLERGDVNLGTRFVTGEKKRGAYYVDVRRRRT
jgi:arylsulfatase A-like enzyme